MIKASCLSKVWVSPLPFEKRRDLGRMCHVTIDEANSTITREFTISKVTAAGKINPFNYTLATVEDAFNNDVHWTTQLDSNYVLKPLSIDYENLSITYPYHGKDLYHDYEKFTSIKDFKEQIIEMYTYFKEQNIFKGNGSRSNLVLVDNKVKAFDFKWTRIRPHNIKLELMSYEIWLKNADNNLETELKVLAGFEERNSNEFTFDD
jgi:hypothetical protein|tara:strand:+ start:1457 stop:2074 length:618 start_codon:yes stop_codon:yes gene_type:complete